MGFCNVEICPKAAHIGAGKVIMTAALVPLIVDFLNQKKSGALDILAYHITDELGVNGTPSMTFRLHGVRPSSANLNLFRWDATSQEILTTEMTLNYERLEMLQEGIPMAQPMPRTRVRVQPSVVM
jgi:hypothetical protein